MLCVKNVIINQFIRTAFVWYAQKIHDEIILNGYCSECFVFNLDRHGYGQPEPYHGSSTISLSSSNATVS